MNTTLQNVNWDKVVLEKQILWKTVPYFYKHKHKPIFAHPQIGAPHILQTIHSQLEPRSTDVNIVTYPKAGTSWLQEITWLINHDADIEQASRLTSNERTVYLELEITAGETDKKLKTLHEMSCPRHIKWHHAPYLLPPGVLSTSKILYQFRNPKDTAVSWYHFQRMNRLYTFTGDFNEFLPMFMSDQVPYGSYWDNLNSWWQLLDQHDNLLITSYEDLQMDIQGQIHKIALHLGKTLNQQQVEAITKHTSFDTMKQNPMVNGKRIQKVDGESDFLRKGKVGDWKNYFTEEQNELCDQWILQNNIHNIPFIYDV